jgi:acyl carrier protein|tara:strand:- start:3688 stop:3927 length:240 start_codon:yes stop_codon:yes gene_type:complete
MENFKQIFDKVLIKTLSINEEDIKPNIHFTNDLGVDSLDLVELTIEFEKVFKITISDEDAQSLQTIGGAEGYLREKIKF